METIEQKTKSSLCVWKDKSIVNIRGEGKCASCEGYGSYVKFNGNKEVSCKDYLLDKNRL